MKTQPDIHTTAKLMRGEYGPDAYAKALENADAFRNKNMPDSMETWKRVATEIIRLDE